MTEISSLPVEDRIGISTHFLPSTHGETLIDAIRAVAEAGFAGFEIVPTLDQAQIGYPHNHPNVGIDLIESTRGEIAELKSVLSCLKWVTVHSPHLDWNLASANRHLRRLTWDYYDRCIEFAAEIRAAAVTFHEGAPTWGYIRPHEDICRLSCDYAEHAVDRARKLGLPTGFEAGALTSLKYVCDRVEGWGINLDIGHAYMAAGSDQGFMAYIDQLGSRIVEVHHNGVNHYFGGYMEHQPPHMNNAIDFAAAYSRLKEIGFRGPIVCEIQGNDIAQVVRHCLESKTLITGIWNGTASMGNRWG